MAETITFRHGSLIRSGPNFINGGKWNADLDDTMCNAHTNAELTINISIFFSKIDPVGAATGVFGDADDGDLDPVTNRPVPSKKKIQKWAPGEFETFKQNLVVGAQRFWDGVFWLKTPHSYKYLNFPASKPTHRCNIYCRFELEAAAQQSDAHYTIAVVRAQDGEAFRSHSTLYSQNDIKAESMIPSSTVKFFTHYHEVGHLIGLGHVGSHGHRNVHGDNSPKAYGVTKREMQDAMGRGSVRHRWHAAPWQEGAAALTGTKKSDWEVYIRDGTPHIRPHPLGTHHAK